MSDRHIDNNATLSCDELAVKQALAQHLDAKLGDLDFNTTSKLAAGRRRALDQKSVSSVWQKWIGWQSVVAGTAALAVAFVVGDQMLGSYRLSTTPAVVQVATGDIMEDLTFLSDSDGIEFYQNIEFLEWLDNDSG